MQIDFAPDKALFPFQSRWFDGAGPRIHYIDEGAGRPVVMFHGNPTWSFLYRKVIQQLSGRFRCVAMDYPGFGLSERQSGYDYTSEEHARVIGKLVDHLNLDGFIVVGQDWGGPIGMTIAMERGQQRGGDGFREHVVLAGQGIVGDLQPCDVEPAVAMADPPSQLLRQLHHS